MPVNLSYPKARNLRAKIIRVLRTDSSTSKFTLPKGAFIIRVFGYTDVAADTGTPSYALGWSGATGALANAANFTSRGQVVPGSAVTGSAVGTQLDSDKEVIGTFSPSTSTTGGTGYLVVEFILPGPGETIDG